MLYREFEIEVQKHLQQQEKTKYRAYVYNIAKSSHKIYTRTQLFHMNYKEIINTF